MLSWPYEVISYSPQEVQLYCVQDPEWQKFRLSMKGLATSQKLEWLCLWRSRLSNAAHNESAFRRNQVQLSNYLNALKRGGQLTMDLKVQR